MKRIVSYLICLLLLEAGVIYAAKGDPVREGYPSGSIIATLVKLLDTNSSHRLSLKWNENDTVNRTLNLKVGNGNRTLTLNENLSIGDGFNVAITAEDAATSIVTDNANFEVENTDGTQRTFKITSAKAGNTILTFQENFSISDGYDVTMVAEDAAGQVTLDNVNLEVEDTIGSGNTVKFVIGTDDASRTVTLSEDFTIGDGNAGTLIFSAASKTLTVEDNSVVNQDLTSDASPTFAGLGLTGPIVASSANTETGKFSTTNPAPIANGSGVLELEVIHTRTIDEGPYISFQVPYINPTTTQDMAVIGALAADGVSGNASAYLTFWTRNTSAAERMRISASGELFVYALNDAAGTYPVEFNTTSKELTYDSSTEKNKTNIKEHSLSNVLNLLAITLQEYEKAGQHNIGFIAEDMDKAGLTDLVIYDSEGQVDGIRYKSMSFYLLYLIRDIMWDHLSADQKTQIETVTRNLWKRQWKRDNATEVEVSEDQAFDNISVLVEDKSKPLSVKTRYVIQEGEKISQRYPVYKKISVNVRKLGNNVRLDQDSGKFYRKVIPTDAQAEAAAILSYSDTKPQWARR